MHALIENKIQRRNIVLIGIILYLLVSSLFSLVSGQNYSSGTIWTLEAESLADAIQIFSTRHQVITTYEDPVLVYSADLQDISSNNIGAEDLSSEIHDTPIYIRRPLKLNLVYHLPENSIASDDITRALQEIVDQYNVGNNPGRFKVETNRPVWHIIPMETRNSQGEWQKEISLLDKVVETQIGRERLYKYIFSVMGSAISNTPFVSFGFNRNAIGPKPPDINVRGGARSLRSLLTDIFTDNFPDIYWQIECGATDRPGESVKFIMNLYRMQPNLHSPETGELVEAREKAVGNHPISRTSRITPRQDASDHMIFHIDIEGNTPLFDAIEGFMRLHQVRISYEDPIYEFAADMDDITMLRKDLDKYPQGQAPRILYPRNTQFQAQYFLDTQSMTQGDITTALRQILDQYNRSDRTAEFKLMEGIDIWHVVPVRIRDQSGIWKETTPLLDEIVHVSGGKTNFQKYVASMLQAACRARGLQDWIFNEPSPQAISLPKGNFMLRDVLASQMTSNFPGLTWYLLYNPSDPPLRGMALKYYRIPPAPLDLAVSHLIKLDETNWKSEVMDTSSSVLVAFMGAWSHPVRDYAATLDELSIGYADRLKMGMVDMGDQFVISAKYDIRIMPTLLFFRGGVVQQHLFGIVSKPELVSWIESGLKGLALNL